MPFTGDGSGQVVASKNKKGNRTFCLAINKKFVENELDEKKLENVAECDLR